MTPALVFLVVALVPVLIAVAIEWRSRREHRRLLAALDEERRESLDAYEADEEVTARRHSFSGWPFPNKRPHE